MKITKKTVSKIGTGHFKPTNKWWARCYSPRLGWMVQWGINKEDALNKLKKFVVCIQKEKWPQETL